jgi:Family of unknown function (DUF6152)
MKTNLLKVTMFCGALLAASAPAIAHHAFAAEFDSNKPIKLQGKVTKMDWINPHSWIHIDVKNADGTVTNWAIECGSPNTLFRHGLNKDSLPSGVEIVVEGYMAKDGGNRANGRDVTFTDGRKLFLGSSAGDTPEGK